MQRKYNRGIANYTVLANFFCLATTHRPKTYG